MAERVSQTPMPMENKAYGRQRNHTSQMTYQMENVHNVAIQTTTKAIVINVDSTYPQATPARLAHTRIRITMMSQPSETAWAAPLQIVPPPKLGNTQEQELKTWEGRRNRQ